MLKSKGLEIVGLVYNGETNTPSEQVIEAYSGVKCIGRVPNIAIIESFQAKDYVQYLEGI